MARIEKLTEEQAAMLPAIRDEYLRHGLSTEPADRTRAADAFRRAYEKIKLAAPRVIWVSSPLGAHLAHAMLKGVRSEVWAQVWDQVWDQVRAEVWDQVRDQVRAEVWDQVWDQVRAEVRDQVWDQVCAEVRDQVRAEVWDQVGDQVRAEVWDQVGDQVRAEVRDQVGGKIEVLYADLLGQHDAGWVAWALAMIGVGVTLRSETADLFRIFHDLAQSCMWAYAFRGAVIACDRPAALHRDERNRLHNDTGPAIEFRDGWKLYFVHGVAVPGWLFTDPNRLTVDAIHAEPNTEVQRVMIERFGWDRYADESGAKIVDHDERWGTLMQRGTGPDRVLFLCVVNRSPELDGSFRKYVLPVDSSLRPIPDPAKPGDDFGEPQHLTALNAVASTFGLCGKEYASLLAAES